MFITIYCVCVKAGFGSKPRRALTQTIVPTQCGLIPMLNKCSDFNGKFGLIPGFFVQLFC